MTDQSHDSGAAGYWSVLEPYWDRIDIYSGPERFLTTYAAAPAVVQTLFAAHFCESEISNGGLHQFFMNPTGVLAPEAVDAFRRIGCPAAAAILERAMAFFGTPYPRLQDDRAGLLDARPGASRPEWDPFVELDAEFDDSLGPEHQPFYDALDRIAAARDDGESTS